MADTHIFSQETGAKVGNVIVRVSLAKSAEGDAPYCSKYEDYGCRDAALSSLRAIAVKRGPQALAIGSAPPQTLNPT